MAINKILGIKRVKREKKVKPAKKKRRDLTYEPPFPIAKQPLRQRPRGPFLAL